MRVLAAALILCAMMGCDGATAVPSGDGAAEAPRVASTPESKLCGRAYSQTVSALGDIAKKAGVDLPKLPDKNKYIGICVDANFTEDQAKCLDPKWFQVDAEACQAALEPKKADKVKLDKLFADAFKESAKKPDPAKAKAPEGTDAPKEDVGAAVEAALGSK